MWNGYAKVVMSLLGSAVLALIVAFVLAAISTSGVTSMIAANVFLWIAAGIFWVAMLTAAIIYCPSLPRLKCAILAIVLCILATCGGIGRSSLSKWIISKKSEQIARTNNEALHSAIQQLTSQYLSEHSEAPPQGSKAEDDYVNERLRFQGIPFRVGTSAPACTKKGIEIHAKDLTADQLHAYGCYTENGIFIDAGKATVTNSTTSQ